MSGAAVQPLAAETDQVTVTRRTLPAKDGYPLAVTIQRGPGEGARRVAVVAAAMGVLGSRYRHYALDLARRGWTVVTFDYRGLGGSRTVPLARAPHRLMDWGEKDLAGILDWTKDGFGAERLVVIGHSIGGQLVGFAGNHDRVDALLAVASQKGYWPYWRGRWRLVVAGFWRLVPILVRLFGYLPLRPVDCENLPPRVALDWRRWCLHPEFVDEDRRSLNHRFHGFRSPILALSFEDDPVYAPRRTVEALMAIYANAPTRHLHLVPDELGVDRFGHSGFFDPGVCPTLWARTAAWLADPATEITIPALAHRGCQEGSATGWVEATETSPTP